MDPIERVVRDVGRNVWPPLKDLLETLGFLAWTGIWAAVAGVGWLFSYAPMINTGLAMIALSLLGAGVVRFRRRRRLRKAARTSLVARARLDRLRLPSEIEAVLAAFDLSFRNITQELSLSPQAGGELAASILRELERAQGRMYEIARQQVRVRADLAELERLDAVRSVAATAAELRAEQAQLGEEADLLATNAQRLQERVASVRRISAGSSMESEPARAALEQVLEDLERTEAAYREIDAGDLKQREARAREQARLRAAARDAGAAKS